MYKIMEIDHTFVRFIFAGVGFSVEIQCSVNSVQCFIYRV
jgi:hypothetical protein